MDRWNKIEIQEINACIQNKFIFEKLLKTFPGKGQPLQQIVLGKLNFHKPKFETRSPTIHPYTKTNSKSIEDLNIRPETMRGKHRGNTASHWHRQ